ncbi:FHA domain-containing protein [Patulibacter sp. NPDC049589]|uniref:FHA domain-containing protein n=1 Tax=Patulibacter sp. NPDC049589 TaxID=3154731 RepID=UPI00342DBACF
MTTSSSPLPVRGLELEAVQRHRALGAPFLTVRPPGELLRIVLLPADHEASSIGRRPGQAVVIDWDARVSRVHARIESIAGSCWLLDDGVSRNGTFVGELRLTGRHRLEDGDVIRVGGTSLAFHDPQAIGNSITVEASDARLAVELSPAQRRVLDALCRPCRPGVVAAPASNQQIAAELVVGIDAVKTQMRALFVALGIEDLPQNRKRARVVERAFELGLVRADHDAGVPPTGA